jgi:uncharacterized protein (TIGR02246 family)
MNIGDEKSADEAAIRALVEGWARAVRSKDYAGILAHHAPEILMFDLPPPLACRGIEAYRATWDLFFAASGEPVVFDFDELTITAGRDVAFATALMQCTVKEHGREATPLEFRVTIGLQKSAGQWTVTHEHHSIPATS